jgi:hypothetical protein
MKTCFAYIWISFLAAACAAEIGDECDYDYDCSPNMERTCDLSQPAGYCLIIGCDPDSCPGEAVCVEFVTPCPEGAGDAGIDQEKCDQIEPNRTRDYCLKHCGSNGDCRSDYVCVDVAKLRASVIDLKNSKSKVCVPEVKGADTDTGTDPS